MRFAIRAASEGDLDELDQIFDVVDALHREHLPHVFREPDGPAREREYMLDVLSDESYRLFVAVAKEPVQQDTDGAILGFVQVAIQDTPPIPLLVPRRVARVENLGVRKDARRAGVGRALMDHAQRWAEESGATEIDLNVHEFNQVAIRFYRNLGYATSSRRMSKRLG